jgi:nucleotide-binding universal stress UspA family protein
MKILLAIDDSKYSESAMKAVSAQAQTQDSQVLVLHVLDLIPIATGSEVWVAVPDFEEYRKRELERSQELMAKASQSLRATGLNVTTHIEEGDAKRKILEVAAEWKPDLIVVGSHGRRG